MKCVNTLLIGFLLIFSINLFAQTYNPDYQDGKVWVKIKDGLKVNIPVNADKTVDPANLSILKKEMQKYNVNLVRRPFDLNNNPVLLKTYELNFDNFADIDKVISDLATNPNVEYAEKIPMSKRLYSPNDKWYQSKGSYGQNYKWHWQMINMEKAWDLTQGSASVKIAIVDDAIYTNHPDLTGKIVSTYDATTGGSNCNPPTALDQAHDDENFYNWSHGSHCAGLAAANTNNSVGVAGAGFNCKIIAVKCARNSDAAMSATYEGVQWAANNGANIISMSWGNEDSQTGKNIFQSAYNMGIILVSAAGNDNATTKLYPASYDFVISVGALDNGYTKWVSASTAGSNYNDAVDIMAPGGFDRTLPSYPTCLLSCTYTLLTYEQKQGTSQACPIVSGICGLIKSVNPSLTPAQVLDIIKSTAKNIDSYNSAYVGKIGAGCIDAYAAVLKAKGGEPPVEACDTLLHNKGYFTGEQVAVYELNESSGGTGYLAGTNSFGDQKFANKYPNSKELSVNSALVWFGVAEGSSGEVQVAVWDKSNEGKPKNMLTYTNIPVKTVVDAVKNNKGVVIAEFLEPAVVTGDFFVSVSIPSVSGVTIALYTNVLNQINGSPYAWMQDKDGDWYDFVEIWGDKMPMTMCIFPIVCTSVDVPANMVKEDNFNIFPNPAKDKLYISYKGTPASKGEISIYNLFGSLVQTIKKDINNEIIEIPVENMKEGLYLITIKTPVKTLTRRVNIIK